MATKRDGVHLPAILKIFKVSEGGWSHCSTKKKSMEYLNNQRFSIAIWRQVPLSNLDVIVFHVGIDCPLLLRTLLGLLKQTK